jgi:hypothetical protein
VAKSPDAVMPGRTRQGREGCAIGGQIRHGCWVIVAEPPTAAAHAAALLVPEPHAPQLTWGFTAEGSQRDPSAALKLN